MRHAEQLVFKASRGVQTAPFDFSGRWKNELQSTMELLVAGSTVTGKYVSAVSDNGGPTPPFDLFGSVSGKLITFYVNWGTEITTWIGHVVNADTSPEILTLWHIVKAVPDEDDPTNQWKMISSGADNFTRA